LDSSGDRDGNDDDDDYDNNNNSNNNIIIIIIVVSFIYSIHTHIPETNHVPREYTVAAILPLLFMVTLSLVPALDFCSFTLALSEVCMQCPLWLFSVVP
jgi:3',5'-cyclic AMP phosphodiesterase CpdA